MRFSLSLDCRDKTIEEGLAGAAVIDADDKRVMIIMPDVMGFYDHAAAVVDVLNAVVATRAASNKLQPNEEGGDLDRG